MRAAIVLNCWCTIPLICCAPSAYAGVDSLVGNTLMCEQASATYDGKESESPYEYARDIRHIYFTRTYMFLTSALRVLETNAIVPDGKREKWAGYDGMVFEWDKAYKDNAFPDIGTSHARKATNGILFDYSFTNRQVLADKVTINISVAGQIYQDGANWYLKEEKRQNIPGGDAAVKNIKVVFRCLLQDGRNLL